ncbi:MAG: pantetheine-phosphate adenylyltransferase [Bdellovibrionales bacterium CG10_big_fil_rev_8_21_14_0_10_45_34]|nr:MAG: pantetheine-phosphate adenylyltransferase [Bdellovibrionales bacterium CG10_big_fil_rev_8_21_14_0_10_45_34]
MKAVYPGTFDPLTLGHLDIIERVAGIFNELVILIAHSVSKDAWFTPAERKSLLEESLKHLKNVTVDIHTGLTVDYLTEKKVSVLVRGLRVISDYEYEMSMANMNHKLAKGVETLIIFSKPEFSFLSSRTVKEVAFHGGPVEGLVPPPVVKALKERSQRR